MLKRFSDFLVRHSYRHSDGMRRGNSVGYRKRSLRLESLESRQLLSVSPMDNSDSEGFLSMENQTVSTVVPPSETVVSPTAEQWEQLQAIRDLYGPRTLEQSELVRQFYSFWETLGVSSGSISKTTTTSFGDTLTLGLDASAVDTGLQTLEDWDAEQVLLESDSEMSSRCGGGCGCGCGCGGGCGGNSYADWMVSMAITPQTNPETQELESREITEVPLSPNVNDMAELVFSYTKPSGCMASAGCMSVQFSVTSFTPNATTLAQYGKEDADAGDVHILSSSGSAWSEIFSSSSESTTVDGGTQTVTLYTTQFYISPTSTPHLYIKARFDWDAEGLYASMTMQGGVEILHMQLVSAYFDGVSTNTAQVSDTVCALPIHDGGILETFCDWDGSGEITDADASYSFRYSNHQVILNEDDDNANNQFDYLDTGTVSGEDDLLLHRSYAWISAYPGGDLPVTVTLPTSRTAHQFWDSAEKGTVYAPTNGLVGTITSSNTTVSDDYYVEGKSTGTSSVLLEVNEPSGCQYTPSGCIPLSSENTFYLHTGIVDLDIDSDNNGYINTSANASRMLVEDVMELGSPKPITYRSSNGDASEEFFWVPLRLSCGNSALVSYYQFVYNSDILEIRSDYTDSGTAINPSQHYFTTGESNRLSDTYYVRARAAGGVQHIKIQAYDSNNQPIGYEYDMVTVNIQDNSTEGISDWVIPSGWTINGNSFTTPKPATSNTVGPKNEGSGVVANSGNAFFDGNCENGFTLALDYSFVRNTSDGYANGFLMPDSGHTEDGATTGRGDEVINGDDAKMGFFGNSGVKIFNLYEIQIFDTAALMNGLNIVEDNVKNGTVEDIDKDNVTYMGDNVNSLISGIPYNSSDKTQYSDLQAAVALQQAVNHMTINFTRNKNSSDEYINSYSIVVTLNNITVYSNSEVTSGTGGASGTSLWKDDGTLRNNKVFLQSHWGSGVTFSNISFIAGDNTNE